MNPRELWVVTGSEPVVWAVPFIAEIVGNQAHLSCAMPLTDYQKKAVCGRLGTSVTKKVTMVTTVRHLQALGHKVNPTPDPEKHFVWERARLAGLGPWKKRDRMDREHFLSAMYLRGVGSSIGELEYWLNQFCNAFVWHLLNKESPIDLYFCKLHPCPYRPGWRTTTEKPSRELLRNGKKLAFDGRACMRTIDLEITRTWWTLMRRIENDRAEMLGAEQYAAEYMAWIERRIPESQRLNALWIAANRSAPAILAKSYKKVRPRFMALRYVPPDATAARADKRVGPPERERQIREAKVRAKKAIAQAKHMRRVRHLQLHPPKLRNARRILRGTANGPAGTVGVQLRNADQGEPGESNVLVERSGFFGGRVV